MRCPTDVETDRFEEDIKGEHLHDVSDSLDEVIVKNDAGTASLDAFDILAAPEGSHSLVATAAENLVSTTDLDDCSINEEEVALENTGDVESCIDLESDGASVAIALELENSALEGTLGATAFPCSALNGQEFKIEFFAKSTCDLRQWLDAAPPDIRYHAIGLRLCAKLSELSAHLQADSFDEKFLGDLLCEAFDDQFALMEICDEPMMSALDTG